MEIVPEPEWEGLLDELVRQKGTALLLGATDSGKSTLAKYLIKRLVVKHIRVSLVDADVGQSTLCLPGTISMKIFNGQRDVDQFTFEKMFFVGSTNPATKIPLMINRTKRMADICREKSEITLIDTTGLVSGELGKVLKIGKVRAVNPEHIIAVQRSDELEHILNLIEGIPIHRIIASRMAKIRDREERMRYRKRKFLDYFSGIEVSEFLLHEHDVKFLYDEKSFSLKEKDFQEGTVIGLNHNGDTIALGIIVEITGTSIIFKSRIPSLKGINRVVFGDIAISD